MGRRLGAVGLVRYQWPVRALYWDGRAPRVVEREVPPPAAGTALIRTALAGICATDLQIVRGYMSFRGVLGHEVVGTVAEGPDAWRGRRVVSEINFACSACPACARGLARHCPARQVMGILGADGAMAEYVRVPVANLHAVPDGVADEAAVSTEPLAAACEILEQVPVSPATTAVVLGDGKLGLLVAQVLATAGARVLAVGKHPAKLARLAGRGIATAALDRWDRTSADLVVDATGSPAGLAAAMAAARPRGTLVLKTTVAEAAALNLAPLVINEITVVGSRCGPFAPALRALAAGTIDVTSLIAARFPLARAADALGQAATPGTLKVLVEAGD
jgi:threonine dehydrogenase-like Zn-dependent dehydrogenase